MAVLDDNPGRVKDLTFSRDGLFLAATMNLGAGVRVWRTDHWESHLSEDNVGYGDSYGADFDDDGWLYTVAYPAKPGSQGRLRAYAPPNFKLVASIAVASEEPPYYVAAQPSGNRIGVTPTEGVGLDIYERTESDIVHVGSAEMSGVDEPVFAVEWSPDGQYLFAAGRHNAGEKYLIRRWNSDGDAPVDFEGADGTIAHLQACGEAIAYAARDPLIGIMESDGRRSLQLKGPSVDMSRAAWGRLRVSADGQKVSFPKRRHTRFGSKETTVAFDVRRPGLDYSHDAARETFPPDYDSLPITGWNAERLGPDEELPTNPRIGTTSLAPPLEDERFEALHRLKDDEYWVSLAIGGSKREFAMASEWRLRGYRQQPDGSWSATWKAHVPGKPWALNYTRDNLLIVAAYGDGTIRWHRAADGTELLALFVHEKEDDWIAWTPGGYFVAGLGGEDLIGWHFNKGPKQAAAFHPVYEFRKQYLRPDMIPHVLRERDERMALESANEEKSQLEILESRIEPLPGVTILDPESSRVFSEATSELEVEYRVDLPAGFSDAVVDFLVDGVVHEPSRRVSDKELGVTLRAYLKLPPQDSLVSVVVTASKPGGDRREGREARFFQYVGTQDPLRARPKLFGLVIGIEAGYESDPLDYPVEDARSIKAALERQLGLFRDPDIRALLGEQEGVVSPHQIRSDLERLRRDVKHERMRGDTVTVVFFSGHGVEDSGGRFHLLASDPPANELSAEAYYAQVGLSQDELYELLRLIPGRKILFLDACRSGNGTSTSFLNGLRARGRLSLLTYASTSDGDNASECPDYRHGCFTQGLLEALRDGRASAIFDPLDSTSTDELRIYLRDRVEPLSKGKQRSKMAVSDEEMRPFLVRKKTER